MKRSTAHLFVYGTLSPRHAPPEIKATVRRLRPVGSASVRGHLYDLGEYPGAVLSKNSRSLIHGQVFELPEDAQTLSSLDDYEGFEPDKPTSSLFVRRTLPVKMEDGTRLRCWIYVYNGAVKDAAPLRNGRYSRRRSRVRTRRSDASSQKPSR
ncbi:MAG TPA: gamma-glutamylcyclotransferase family protein [Candidatus Sulfotelmatobacter sp.]|nr:gamma-glutamylcyclotransferase family protein [Candidatus Sulfotelmatobacter sp.]